jgi:hypothetical protein
MRVAVGALEDTLLRREGSAVDVGTLVPALAALSRSTGGTDAAALERALPLWTAWTSAERESEARLADVYVKFLTRIDAFPQSGAELPSESGAGGGAPGSPFAPVLPLIIALDRVQRGKPERPPAEVPQLLRTSRERYDALGWPGGYGRVCERWVRMFGKAPWSLSPLRLRLSEEASVSYAQSGDAVREALVLTDRARVDRSLAQGPMASEALTNAALLSQQALLRIETVETRGPERLHVALTAAEIALSARDFAGGAERAARAADWARQDDAPLAAQLGAAEIESACRLRAGEFDAAARVA